ncbi:ArgJ family-domain-containing protein [Chytridium lagenaria]|nr:ArgJ family-domain-containing protein [Chytridium lagenaria]
MVGVGGITADNAENHPDIEKQWAVKAMHHAETYFKLISSIEPSKLRLTKFDDEIYKDFRTEWPDLKVEKINEVQDFKTEKSKEKWRNWMAKYEKQVVDYNFGTLLRIDPSMDYSAENAFFATTASTTSAHHASKDHLIAKSGIYPKDFVAGAVSVGIKKPGKLDMTLVHSLKPCTAAGVFTKNTFAAAPVQVCKDILQSTNGTGLSTVIVNSGCANACTGSTGLADAWSTVTSVDKTFSSPPPPPSSCITALPPVLSSSHQGWHAAATGIMTTDTFPKLRSHAYSHNNITTRFAGWSKGAGMIHPNMATMLSAIFTDAHVSKPCLDHAVKYVADRSFNAVSVDGDTSTNDTFLVLANGAAGAPLIDDPTSQEFLEFRDNLLHLAKELAKLIVRDGEGATKFVEIRVKGATSFDAGKQIASTIATSPLVKTAIFGRDANWGRIICAVGYSGVPIEPSQVSLYLKSADENTLLRLFHQGGPDNVDEEVAATILDQEDILVEVVVGEGEGVVSMYTCDFSHGYISINADYRS